MPHQDICPSCHRPYQKRSQRQNNVMWSMLHDLADQTNWHGQKLIDEEWKDLLTAGLKQQRFVPGIEGGIVVLGAHTSAMSKKDLSDLVDLIRMFGDQRGIKWSVAIGG